MTEDLEIWRPVVNFEDYYEVSSHGSVKSLAREVTRSNQYGESTYIKPERILNPTPMNTKRGQDYLKVCCFVHGKGHNFLVHRLVAQAFLPFFDPSLPVDHIDGNGMNNHFTNIHQIPHAQNIREAYKNFGPRGASFHKTRGLWRSRHITQAGNEKFLGYFDTQEEAQAAFYMAYLKEFGTPPWNADSDGKWTGPDYDPNVIIQGRDGKRYKRSEGRAKKFRENKHEKE